MKYSVLFTLPAVAMSQLIAQNTNSSKPNIILIVTDDHGKDALGCYGNKIIETPELDKLAAQGVRFSNAYCISASSAASRAALLSGCYSHAIGAYGHTHDYHHFSTYTHVRSLPTVLAENGYYTARIGKYHLAPESVYPFDTIYNANPRNTVEMAEQSKGVFTSNEPFFLYFCPDDPHRSDFTSQPSDWRTPNAFGNRKEGFKGVQTKVYDPKDVIVPSFLPDNAETRAELAEYYQSISRIDQGVGVLLNALEQSGKSDNTVVIYISDNGMAFPGAKTTIYNAGIELPCIVRSPFVAEKGIVNNAMISWVDMAPTLLDIAGVDYRKEKMQGKSFATVIGEEQVKGWDKIYASHNFHEITMYYPMRALHERKYKLIWNAAWRLEYPFASDLWISSTWQHILRNEQKYYGERKTKDYLFRPEFELYDIENDPNEAHNLAYDRKYAKTLERMLVDMKAWQLKTRDPWYILWDNDPSLQGTGEEL